MIAKIMPLREMAVAEMAFCVKKVDEADKTHYMIKVRSMSCWAQEVCYLLTTAWPVVTCRQPGGYWA